VCFGGLALFSLNESSTQPQLALQGLQPSPRPHLSPRFLQALAEAQREIAKEKAKSAAEGEAPSEKETKAAKETKKLR
jgi:hypothetical protein